MTEYTERRQPKMAEATYTGLVVGRDQKVIDPEEVEKLAGLGCNDREIADWFGIAENTLRYNFSGYLTKGREHLKQTLRRAQINLALKGNAVMLIWLGKNILGQSDQPQRSDTDLKPLPWSDDDEPRELTDEQRQRLQERIDEYRRELEAETHKPNGTETKEHDAK